jgi:hypothetical protein
MSYIQTHEYSNYTILRSLRTITVLLINFFKIVIQSNFTLFSVTCCTHEELMFLTLMAAGCVESNPVWVYKLCPANQSLNTCSLFLITFSNKNIWGHNTLLWELAISLTRVNAEAFLFLFNHVKLKPLDCMCLAHLPTKPYYM